MENKTGKYFKYAVGEIILVVIGILIALQVNNWNENCKKSEIENNTIIAIVDELKAVEINLIATLNTNEEILKDMTSYLDGTFKESHKNSPKIVYLTAHNNTSLEMPLIISILENNENQQIRNPELLKNLRSLNSLNKKMSINESFLDEFWNSSMSAYLVRKEFAFSVIDKVVRRKMSQEVNYRALYDDEEYKNLISIKWILHNSWISDQKKTLNQLNKILENLEKDFYKTND